MSLINIIMVKNKRLGDYKYMGTYPEWEDYIANLCGYYLNAANASQREATRKIFTNYYNQLIQLNPELKNINLNQVEYVNRDMPEDVAKSMPLYDFIFGVASGFAPKDIKNYIEVTKGAGGRNVPAGYNKDVSKGHIQLTPNN